jgi:hypothetical protein
MIAAGVVMLGALSILAALVVLALVKGARK